MTNHTYLKPFSNISFMFVFSCWFLWMKTNWNSIRKNLKTTNKKLNVSTKIQQFWNILKPFPNSCFVTRDIIPCFPQTTTLTSIIMEIPLIGKLLYFREFCYTNSPKTCQNILEPSTQNWGGGGRWKIGGVPHPPTFSSSPTGFGSLALTQVYTFFWCQLYIEIHIFVCDGKGGRTWDQQYSRTMVDVL